MIAEPGDGWIRLSPLKLLLDPVKTLGQFLVPVLIALVGISSGDSSGRFWPYIAPVLLLGPIIFGLLPWFTTHYRQTPTQFQLRSGWLNKKQSTAPLDRIRTVDLEATLLHRILGLAKVQIGTGVDDERLTLDALDRASAQGLRENLLSRSPATTNPRPDIEAVPDESPSQVLAAIDWSWLRYAPLSLTRLVVLAGAIGVLSQFGDQLPIWDEETAVAAWDWVTGFALALIIPVVLVGLATAWLMLSVSGYVVQWWNFRLVRERDSLHLTHGLFTTKSVSVDETKIRGVEMTEPWLMQPFAGAELSALATGLEDGVHPILPACPLTVATGVGEVVLGEIEPLRVSLRRHGAVARRRSWIRQISATVPLAVALSIAFWFFGLPWWWLAITTATCLIAGLLIGEAAYRHLGHALTEHHLIAGSGTLARIRTILEIDGIIGWVFHQSLFQRRLGLCNLVATTAAGSESVVIRDVSLERAVRLSAAATPDLLKAHLDPAGHDQP